MGFTYDAAGLTLVANVRLHYLPPAPLHNLSSGFSTNHPDLFVHVGSRPDWASDPLRIEYTSAYTDSANVPVLQLARGANGLSLAYADRSLFWIDRDASTVWMTYESTLEDACTYLVGPVLSLMLRLRGDFSLHASAVVCGAGAVAFAGPHGAGKSTAAAAFGRRGLPVLTDDVLRMTPSDRTWLAHPLGGILRLWPDGESIVFGERDRLDPITPNWNKRALTIGAGGVPAATTSIPLAGVVFLKPDENVTSISVTQLSAAEAAVHLAANSSAAHLLDAAARTHEFHQVIALASSVPCAMLTRPADDSSLHDSVSALTLWMEKLAVDAAVSA